MGLTVSYQGKPQVARQCGSVRVCLQQNQEQRATPAGASSWKVKTVTLGWEEQGIVSLQQCKVVGFETVVPRARMLR